MPSIQVTIHHRLTELEAMARIKHLVTKLKHEHKNKISDTQEEWHARHGKFHFAIRGFNLSGTVDLHPGTVEIHGKIPFALALFRGKIKEVIKEKANELFAE